jgi:hypothetical protein
MTKFNSRAAAKKKRQNNDQLSIVHHQVGNDTYKFHEEDPNAGHMDREAALMSKHYLKGCGNKCKPGCTGSYRDQGLKRPDPVAVELFGLAPDDPKNLDGEWHHDPSLTKMARLRTLTDIADIPVTVNDFEGEEKVAKKRKFSDFLLYPQIKITKGKGKFDRGISAGQYIDESGNKRFGAPMEKIGLIHGYAQAGYNRLIESGSTKLADYFKVAKVASALSDGTTISAKDSRPSENRKFRRLSKNGVPANAMTELNHVVRHIASRISPDFVHHEDPDVKEALNQSHRENHNAAKTAEFAMCFCPHCVLDQSSTPTNTIFDIQDRTRAAKHPATSDSFFAGSPQFHHPDLGEGLEGRTSDLGRTGKQSPHNGFWIRDAIKYITAAVRGRKNEENPFHPGPSALLQDARLHAIDPSEFENGGGVSPFVRNYDYEGPTEEPESTPKPIKRRRPEVISEELTKVKEKILNPKEEN